MFEKYKERRRQEEQEKAEKERKQKEHEETRDKLMEIAPSYLLTISARDYVESKGKKLTDYK